MITRRSFLRIQKKLRKKQNILRIASETGATLEIISAIADGWIPTFPKPGRPRLKPEIAEDSMFPFRDPPEKSASAYLQNSDEEPQRCPECGALVFMPCLECRLHHHRHAAVRLRLSTAGDEMLSLDLRPEWRERYEKIHQEKIARREQELERRLAEEATSQSTWRQPVPRGSGQWPVVSSQ